MEQGVTILICSDVHYACEEEKKRKNYEARAVGNPVLRWVVTLYRRYIWLRDPFAHNHLLEHALSPPVEPDHVVVNGDYSCDSAFIGLADPASAESAQTVLGRFRARYGERFRATFGDHELGKISLCGGQGGLRLESWRVAREELNLSPFWEFTIGRYTLMGITSTLVAMPVYEREALPEERDQWNAVAAEHIEEIRAAFAKVPRGNRILLFCHDPTALPYLGEIAEVQSRIGQIERTIIGHLHSPFVLRTSRRLSGLPKVSFCGAAVRRMSSALSRGKKWEPFNVMLCPSLAGIQLKKDGGYYLATVDSEGNQPVQFKFIPVPWQ